MEERGKDYPCYKDKVKMHKAMSSMERKEWFSDQEISQWKKANPEGEQQGSLP